MSFWPFQSFVGTFISLFSFLVLYIIYKLVIKVYLDMRYYTKQGAIPIYHRKFISFATNYKNAVEKGDFYLNYKELARQYPKAKCFVENFGSRVMLIPVDNDMIKQFIARYEVYHKARGFIGLIADLIDGAISFTEGIPWKKQRKHMSAAFHYEFLKNVTPMMVEVIQGKFASWIKNGDIEHFDVLQQIGTMTGEVVGRFFFGQRFSKVTLWGLPLTAAGQMILSKAGAEAFTLSNLLLGPKFARMGILKRHKELNKAIQEFRGTCKGLITEVEKSDVKENNLLNILLEQRYNETLDERLTDNQIVGRFVGVFIAGTETTALAINSALYNMSKYPNAARKLKEEIEREVTDVNSFTMETLNKLEYTTAFIKETLRCGSTVGALFFRVASKDDNLCGVHVKKGTMLNIYMQVSHYSEDNFSDPYEFIPERWLGAERANDDTLRANDQAFYSFSGGPRSCIGQHFGMIEAKIIISMLLKTFDIEFPKDYKMVLVPRTTLVPVKPFVIKLIPKNVA